MVDGAKAGSGVTSRKIASLIASVNAQLRMNREEGLRRGLEHAGYCQRSVELAIEKNREWINNGEGK